jgi:hypothetical protein
MKPNLLVYGLLFTLAGCAGPEKYTKDMTTRETAFYKHGPQQPGAPDLLPPQTFVRVLEKDSGYTFAQLADGRTGYLATEDLRLAPPSARAVAETELFPERMVVMAPLPEPDLTMPVEDIPQTAPSKVPR